jgi:hypothetical protein
VTPPRLITKLHLNFGWKFHNFLDLSTGAAMRASIFLALLLLTSSAIAQLSTSVGSVVVHGTRLCEKLGKGHAACSRTWKSPDGDEEVSGGGTANVIYGTLSAHAKAIVNCSTSCDLSAQTVSEADFTDTANIQNAPAGGSFFLISISLSGFGSNVNMSSAAFDLNLNNTTSCIITADKGSCHARVPVDGPTASFAFTAELISSVNAILQRSSGTDNEYLTLDGHISELAVVDANGNVLKDVVITTASGHKYPE